MYHITVTLGGGLRNPTALNHWKLEQNDNGAFAIFKNCHVMTTFWSLVAANLLASECVLNIKLRYTWSQSENLNTLLNICEWCFIIKGKGLFLPGTKRGPWKSA